MTNKTFYILFLCLGMLHISTYAAGAAPKSFVVVIDAGHGGNDPGAIGSKIREKDINLSTALELGRLIENNCADVKVVYTRKKDVFVPLQDRALIANRNKADLFISIHTNAVPKGKIVYGAETYTLGMARANENLEVAKKENSVILMENGYKETYKGFNPNSSESYIIFEFMQDKNMNQSVNLAKKIQQQFKKSGRQDRGVHQAGFLVLRETAMPSVLVELGYISTPAEAQFLHSQEGISKMARSIYNAFISYRNNNVTKLQDEVQTQDAPLVSEQTASEPEDPVEVHPIQGSTAVRRHSSRRTREDDLQEQEPTAVQVQPIPVDNRPAVNANIQEKPVSQPKQAEPKKQQTAKAPKGVPVFKIQILTSGHKLPNNDRQFKGLKVSLYQDGNKYKYSYYESTNYNEVLRVKKEITTKFKDCFIVAFKNGKPMNVNDAIREFKNRKK